MSVQRNKLRVEQELKRMNQDPPSGISLWPIDGQLDNLEATIEGPEGTPYFGGEFHLSVIIPERYPMLPPTIRFTTPIYHPNINNSGVICLDTLKSEPHGKWKPSLNLSVLLTQIRILMEEPNPEDPLDTDIADQFTKNRAAFYKEAQKQTQLHAMLQTTPEIPKNQV